jgi:hypothetical protein
MSVPTGQDKPRATVAKTLLTTWADERALYDAIGDSTSSQHRCFGLSTPDADAAAYTSVARESFVPPTAAAAAQAKSSRSHATGAPRAQAKRAAMEQKARQILEQKRREAEAVAAKEATQHQFNGIKNLQHQTSIQIDPAIMEEYANAAPINSHNRTSFGRKPDLSASFDNPKAV